MYTSPQGYICIYTGVYTDVSRESGCTSKGESGCTSKGASITIIGPFRRAYIKNPVVVLVLALRRLALSVT